MVSVAKLSSSCDFVLVNNASTWRISAPSDLECLQWISDIQSILSNRRHPTVHYALSSPSPPLSSSLSNEHLDLEHLAITDNVTKGWMYLHGKYPTWKRRWMVIGYDCLSIYQTEQEHVLDHSISFCAIIAIRDLTVSASSRCIIELETAEKKYQISSGNDLLTHQKWLSSLRNQCHH